MRKLPVEFILISLFFQGGRRGNRNGGGVFKNLNEINNHEKETRQ